MSWQHLTSKAGVQNFMRILTARRNFSSARM